MIDIGTVVLGGIISVAACSIATINSLPSPHVQKCVEAYYSDKYNNHPAGKPSATFLTCMEKNFYTTFQDVEARYKPQNVTAQPPQ